MACMKFLIFIIITIIFSTPELVNAQDSKKSKSNLFETPFKKTGFLIETAVGTNGVNGKDSDGIKENIGLDLTILFLFNSNLSAGLSGFTGFLNPPSGDSMALHYYLNAEIRYFISIISEIKMFLSITTGFNHHFPNPDVDSIKGFNFGTVFGIMYEINKNILVGFKFKFLNVMWEDQCTTIDNDGVMETTCSDPDLNLWSLLFTLSYKL
jgi:hypothetical protein